MTEPAFDPAPADTTRPPLSCEAQPGGDEPVLLLEDGPLLAVYKPAGLLTQGVPEGVPTLEAWVKQRLREKYQKPGNVYLGVPHRLDRASSGIVVFAKNSKAAARLAEEFRERRVAKIYWAIVSGEPTPSAGTWRDHLLKVADEARTETVPPDTPHAKEAVLDYRVLRTLEGRSWVEITLHTGRMHQIRVQCAARGHSVCGDTQYGSAEAFDTRESDSTFDQRIALHARSLTLRHPIRYEPLTIVAPLPRAWRRFPGLVGDEASG